MASLSNLQQKYGQKIGTASLFTGNQRLAFQNQALQAQQEAAAKENQNNGGFFGGVGYLFEKVGAGFLSGVEGIWDYTAGGIAKLFGADDWAERQFANDWVNYNHADEWFNPSEGWQFAGDIAGGIGTSLPAIIGTAAGAAIIYFSGGSLTGVGAKLILGSISALIAGFGAAGNATKEAYRETGELGGKEFGYGALSGATEAGIEFLTAGIGKGTGRIVSSFAGKAAKEAATETAESVAKTVAKKGVKEVFKQLGEDFATEAFEEGLAEVLSPVYQRMTYNPDAQNATLEEVGYAALVGGLSGMVMSGSRVGIGSLVNTTENYVSGNNAVKNGTVEGILEAGRAITDAEVQNDTGIEVFQSVKETYEKLTESLKTTDGVVSTVKQKMLLGKLKLSSVMAHLHPYIEKSARGLVFSAETAAQRFSSFGMTDANGNAINVTAEQILSGIDAALVEKARNGTLTKSETKTFTRSLRKALSTNSVLATLAVAEATGSIMMDTRRFAEAALNGENIANAADLNRLIEKGKPEELEALAGALGIQDWSKVTIDEFKAKVAEYNANNGFSEFAEQSRRMRRALEQGAESAKPLPHLLRKNMQDGVYRYTSEDNSVNMAIFKEGDTYRLYDYDGGNISRSMTVQEVNKVLNKFWTTGRTTSAQTMQYTEETNLARETTEIDALAAREIVGYKSMSEPNKAAVRMTIRQARANGLAEAETLVFAKVAAKSGLNIIFDGERAFGDGSIQGNTIFVNPNNSAERTFEVILGHEMFHKIFADGDKRALKLFMEAKELLGAEKTAEITERYKKFYEQQGTSHTTANMIAAEEVAAAGAEEVFRNADAWSYILSKDPTISEKVLSFFRKSAREYSSIEGLSSQARKFVRHYKQLFESIAEGNQGNNALALTLEGRNVQKMPVTNIIGEEMRVTGDNDEGIGDAEADTDTRYALIGRTEDGRGIYRTNYPKNTPKSVKQKDIVDLVQNVWSKKPIKLTLVLEGKEIPIEARFNPELTERSDLSKIAFGNRKGTASDKRITMNLSSDLYQIAEESHHVGSKVESGKSNAAHSGVSVWHYFLTDLVYVEEDGTKIECYMNIDVKQNDSGHWFYSFAIEKGSRPADVLSVVTDKSATTSTISITENAEKINPSDENSSESAPKKRFALPANVEERVLAHFGKTYNWRETGYIFKDGTRLDLSGRNDGAPGGYRSVDHREIFSIEEFENGDTYGTEALIEFMQRGNIRVMPETPGINLILEPTDAQYDKIADMVERLAWKEKYFSIDFDNSNGDTVDNLTYEGNVSARKVIADIKYYFKEGKIPYKSELSQFRYALKEDVFGFEIREGANINRDLLEELSIHDPSAEVDINGNITVYHRTSAESADIIRRTGIMTAKEDALFFSSKESDYASDYGAAVVKLKIPSTVLRVNDIFDGEVHFDIPLRRVGGKWQLNVSRYLVEDDGSGDIRYALPERDSNGTELSADQRSYFEHSQQLDGEGRLQVMYQGSPEEFYTFDKKKSKPSNLYGRGFYFTNSESQARHYGNVRAYYLNITHPLAADKRTITRLQMRKFLNAVAKNEDYSIENYGTYDVAEVLRRVYEGESKTDFAMLYDVSLTAIGDLVEAVELFNEVNGTDYDGFILNTESVTFRSEQAKLTQNTSPTTSEDTRYALTGDEFIDEIFGDIDMSADENGNTFDIEAILERGLPRKPGASTLTVGEMKKVVANNTHYEVFSKKTALDVIGKMLGTSDLTQKTRLELADALWQGFNDCTDIESRQIFAHDMAEFIVAKIITEAKVENPDIYEAQERLSYLSTYIGSVTFHPDYLSEIRHIADKDGLKRLLGRWGYKGKKNTSRVPMDVFVCDIAREMPGMEEFENMHPAEAFIELDAMYERAREDVKDKWISAYWDMPDSDIPAMVAGVEADIMRAFEEQGEQSRFSKLVEGRIEYYSTRAEFWKAEHDKIKGRDRLLGLLMSQAQKMKNLRLGTFANSTEFDSELFKNSIEKLAKIQFRGNLNVSGTRKIMGELLQWYRKDNPLLEYEKDDNPGYYVQSIADMLESLSEGKKGFTKEELATMYNVMSYFIKFVENYGKIFKNGRMIEAIPEAQRYIGIAQANEGLKVGLFAKLSGSWYAELFNDPASLVRRMDYYERGFYTETFEDLREASVDAEIAEMQIMEAYDAFLHNNKHYIENITKELIEYRGQKIPKLQLIDLYMTMKRKHAWAGLAINGFKFRNLDGNIVRVPGFVADEHITEAELEAAITAQQQEIAKNFTEADREYMAILEKGYNEDARQLKAERDMQRLGFTNATTDYYYPIRRAYTVKNVDAPSTREEYDRVTNSSFNKDIVTGAKQELAIESADARFRRHIHAVCQYAYLSPALEAFNRLYNLDTSGNKNHPVSVRTASENVWGKGFQYFMKLISDIQGIPTGSSEGIAALSFIRGSYAKFQLGANPKVWLTQLSSIFASSSILDADSIARGMFLSSKGIDEYCALAKLRSYDNTAAMAQGVLDRNGKTPGKFAAALKKTSKFSDVLMSPIGKMDRFVVCRIFGACQVQVEKNGGAKVGTEANKIEAGKLLRKVILETQQNSVATERSAAMRSSNELLRTVTMFTSDSMKVIGRVIDAIGEISVLKSRLKLTTDADTKAEIQKRLKVARRNARKAINALVLTAVFMACIAQLFRHIYDKEQKEDESVAETMLVDAVGNLFGGLPLIKDAYGRIFEGYDIDNYAYSSINDLLNSTINLFTTAGNIMSSEATSQDIAVGIKNLFYSVGQVTGLPVRNVYNIFYGLTKRFSPETAYKIDGAFYKKNYQNDFYKAIEEDDAEMAAFIMGLLYNDRTGTNMSEALHNELYSLSASGYKVLPKSAPSSVSIDGREYELSETEKNAIRSEYAAAHPALEKLFASGGYKKLSEEMKAEAVNYVYEVYYNKALEEALGVDKGKTVLLSNIVGADTLALLYVSTSGITSDTDRAGNTISGSKRRKIVNSISKLSLSREQKLLLICAKGYAIKDGDIPGLSAERAKMYLLKYILKLRGVSKDEKAELAEMCGFTVKNGKIITKSPS